MLYSLNKYLKRYLQIPPFTNNEITHFLCGTVPLTKTLFENSTKSLQTINLSIPIPGNQLKLVREKVSREDDYHPSDLIPNEVLARISMTPNLPCNKIYRKKLAQEIYNLNHRDICKRKEFHVKPDPTSCICNFCNNPMNWYHVCAWYQHHFWLIVANKLSIYLFYSFNIQTDSSLSLNRFWF